MGGEGGLRRWVDRGGLRVIDCVRYDKTTNIDPSTHTYTHLTDCHSNPALSYTYIYTYTNTYKQSYTHLTDCHSNPTLTYTYTQTQLYTCKHTHTPTQTHTHTHN